MMKLRLQTPPQQRQASSVVARGPRGTADAAREAIRAQRDIAQAQEQQEQQHVASSRRALLLMGTVAAASAILTHSPPASEAAVQATTANIELVRAMLNDQVAGNVDGVLKHQAKNVVWRLPVAYSGDPLGGEFQGKKGVLVYLTRQGAQTKDMALKNLKLQESSRNEVIAQYRMSGKLKASKFSTSVTQVWRLTGDGLVASMVAYYDTASIAKAAGIKKSAD